MVSFRTLLVSILPLAAPIAAAITPSQIAANIRSLSTQSQALERPAQSISMLNGLLVVAGQGPVPTIVNGLNGIVSKANALIDQMEDLSHIPAGTQSDIVVDSFNEFARIHQSLLKILINKAGLFGTLPVIGKPVVTALRQVETAANTIAWLIVDKVQSPSSNMQSQANALFDTLEDTIKAYGGGSLNLKQLLPFTARDVPAAVEAAA